MHFHSMNVCDLVNRIKGIFNIFFFSFILSILGILLFYTFQMHCCQIKIGFFVSFIVLCEQKQKLRLCCVLVLFFLLFSVEILIIMPKWEMIGALKMHTKHDEQQKGINFVYDQTSGSSKIYRKKRKKKTMLRVPTSMYSDFY